MAGFGLVSRSSRLSLCCFCCFLISAIAAAPVKGRGGVLRAYTSFCDFGDTLPDLPGVCALSKFGFSVAPGAKCACVAAEAGKDVELRDAVSSDGKGSVFGLAARFVAAMSLDGHGKSSVCRVYQAGSEEQQAVSLTLGLRAKRCANA